MKKIYTLLAFAASLFLFSCADNSEEVFQDKQVKVDIEQSVGGAPIDFDKVY